MKKLLCVLFALTLVVATLTPVALVSAGSAISVSASADEESVKVGDTVTVTFTLPSKVIDVKSGNIVFSFGDAFEIVEDDTYWALMQMTISTVDFDNNKGAFAFFGANKKINAGSTLFVLTLEAINENSGQDITADFEFKTLDGENHEIQLGTGSATATVEVTSDTCPHTNTEERYDASQHWTYCTDCNTELEGTRGNHIAGSATCQAKAVCVICAQPYGEFAEHNYSATTVDPQYLVSDKTCTSYAVYYKSCKWCGVASETETFEDVSGGYAEHQYEDAWINNETQHWHKCSNSACTETSGTAPHTFENMTDGTQHWKECSVCGYKKDIANHVYGDWLTSAEQHWKECGCGVKAQEGNHEYDNACDTTCNVCGHTRTITHDYDTTWKSDASSHWHECKVCEAKTDVSGHAWSETVLEGDSNLRQAADCTNAATYYKVCSACGEVSTTEYFSYGEPATHNYAEQSTDATYLATAKTCTAYAKYYYKCTGCSACGTETWDDVEGGMAAHNYTAQSTDSQYLVSAADCQNYAVYYKSCAVCGAASETDTFEDVASGYGAHNYDTDNWSNDGTNHWHACVTSGCTAKKDYAACSFEDNHNDTQHWEECSVCGDKKNISEHMYGAWITSAEQHWKECGCGVKAQVGDHDYDNACDTTCNTCGYTRTITHDYDMTTWATDGTHHWHECTVCLDQTGKAAHTWAEVVDAQYLVSDKTCTSYAVYYKSCSVCGKTNTALTFQDTESGYAEHDYNTDYSYDAESHWLECANCQAVKEVSLDVHSGGTATCEAKAVCSICGQEYGEYAQHDYSATTIDPQYLVSDKTCTSYAVYYKSCVWCGAASEETFEDVEGGYAEHNPEVAYDSAQHWTVCSVCEQEIEGSRESHDLLNLILPDKSNLKTAATETTPAVYYKTCYCGYISDTETFEEVDYIITNGDNSTWKGESTLAFRSNADLDKLVAVLVDGVVVDPSCYTATSGSTIITFTEDYLKTLANGDHTIVIQSMDGDAEGKFTVAKTDGEQGGQGGQGGSSSSSTALKTGDNSSTIVWIMVTIAAAIAMAVVFVAPRKKER